MGFLKFDLSPVHSLLCASPRGFLWGKSLVLRYLETRIGSPASALHLRGFVPIGLFCQWKIRANLVKAVTYKGERDTRPRERNVLPWTREVRVTVSSLGELAPSASPLISKLVVLARTDSTCPFITATALPDCVWSQLLLCLFLSPYICFLGFGIKAAMSWNFWS